MTAARRGHAPPSPSGLGVAAGPGDIVSPLGRVAQRESACFTRKRSQVQNLPRPPITPLFRGQIQPWALGAEPPSPCSSRCERVTSQGRRAVLRRDTISYLKRSIVGSLLGTYDATFLERLGFFTLDSEKSVPVPTKGPQPLAAECIDGPGPQIHRVGPALLARFGSRAPRSGGGRPDGRRSARAPRS